MTQAIRVTRTVFACGVALWCAFAAPARAADSAQADSVSAAPPDTAAVPAPAPAAEPAPAVAIETPAPVPVDDARADSVSWTKGRQWLSLRAGYAMSSAGGAANGNVGGGIGYSRFLTRRWAVGLYVHDELLGKFGGAAEIEMPITAEIQRHSKWGPSFRPYLALGAGAFYHRFYRTSADESKTSWAPYLAFGANTPISRRHVLGLDVRAAMVPEADDNPVFRRYAEPFPVTALPPGTELHELDGSNVHWSLKVNYAMTW